MKIKACRFVEAFIHGSDAEMTLSMDTPGVAKKYEVDYSPEFGLNVKIKGSDEEYLIPLSRIAWVKPDRGKK